VSLSLYQWEVRPDNLAGRIAGTRCGMRPGGKSIIFGKTAYVMINGSVRVALDLVTPYVVGVVTL